jgi:murein DD-endopeptidase MepM/ murein hydrolase activator NlpD
MKMPRCVRISRRPHGDRCDVRRGSRTWRWLLVISTVVLLAGAIPTARAGDLDPDGYEVRPGDTLAAVSARFGVPVRELMRVNGLRDPRDLRVGQVLALGSAIGVEGAAIGVAAGDELLTLSRAAGASPAAVARANHLLRPTGLPIGLALWLPQGRSAAVTWPDSQWAMALAPRVTAAVRYGVPLWSVMRLNPIPTSLGQPLLIPMSGPQFPEPLGANESDLPYPVKRVRVSEQPIARGDTAVVTVETAIPVRCVFSYLDRREVCLDPAGEGLRWHSLVALPPMLAPGAMAVTIELHTELDDIVVLPVTLHVAPGRFDYERIDLPSDRQSLLDPQLSQAETATIAALRPLRSPERYWTYPFRRPVESAVTSFFGSRRSYGYGFTSYHAGTDFDGETGMPVFAPSDGVVVLAERLLVRGNAIMIDHGWGVVSGYWHLSEIGVAVGQHVSQGDLIGALGNTGLSTGAHLHWELWVNGVAVDALAWLDPDGPAALLGPMP